MDTVVQESSRALSVERVTVPAESAGQSAESDVIVSSGFDGTNFAVICYQNKDDSIYYLHFHVP